MRLPARSRRFVVYKWSFGAFQCFSSAWIRHFNEFSGDISTSFGRIWQIISPLNSSNFSTSDMMNEMNFRNFIYFIIESYRKYTHKKRRKKQKKKRKLIYNKAIQHFFGFEVPLIEVVVSGGLRSPNGIPPEYTLSIGTIGLQEKRFSFLFHFVLAPPTL